MIPNAEQKGKMQEGLLSKQYPEGSFIFVDNGVTLTARYHIRQVTANGPKLGGGIDSPVLCGMFDRGWFDKDLPFVERRLENSCQNCVFIYREKIKK